MKRKRLLCAILILAMAASTAGCGQSYDSAARGAGSPAEGIAEDGAFNGTYGAATKGDSFTAETEAYDDSYDADVGIDREYDAADVLEGAVADAGDSVGTVRAATDDKAEKVESEVNLPEAGQLTAGEWSDNENWGFFSNLVNSGTIEFPSFGINPTNRTAVTVKKKDGTAIVNAQARLLDKDGNVLWSGVTDKQGIAYLFNQGNDEAAAVEIESQGKKQKYDLNSSGGNEQSEKKADNQELEITFDGEDKLYKSMDIMFILDTTSSMSDEMLFLQSEFSAITKAVGTKDTRYAVNFYRDDGDEYVTKCSDFTSDVKELQKKLNGESAEGGGDYPEAVDKILQETMFDGGWNDESVKIAFLIFDAPPHEGTEKVILSAVEEAAKKGVRIVPIVASDNDRDTELFGRALAITTGGDYVFLTDDSGIGNSHTEPIIGSYDVRKLYDIIIDVINDYRQ